MHKLRVKTWKTVTGATAMKLTKGMSTMQLNFATRQDAANFLRAARRAR